MNARGSPAVWSVALPLQVPRERDDDTPLGSLEGGTAGLRQENLPNLERVIPVSVPAWQDSRSSNDYKDKSKHMTQDRKFGLFLAKSPFSCKALKVPEP